MNHGSPDAAVRHVGDLGNIETEADDEDTEFVIVDDEISLDPDSDVSILGTNRIANRRTRGCRDTKQS